MVSKGQPGRPEASPYLFVWTITQNFSYHLHIVYGHYHSTERVWAVAIKPTKYTDLEYLPSFCMIKVKSCFFLILD